MSLHIEISKDELLRIKQALIDGADNTYYLSTITSKNETLYNKEIVEFKKLIGLTTTLIGSAR